MKLSVQKQLDANKVKAEMRAALLDRPDMTEAEQRTWNDRITKADNEHLEAVKYEAGEDAILEAEGVIAGSRVTAEQREFQRMFDRADGDQFLRDAAIGSNSGGAAAEMRKELLHSDDPMLIPLAALLPSDAFAQRNAEQRADVSTSLGSDYGGTSVETLAARVQARMTVTRENLSNVPGLLQGWQNDLRGALTIERDRMVLSGQATVNNVSPAVAGILMDANITDPTNPGDIATYIDYLNAFDDVDTYSDDGSNIRVITNADVFKHARGLSVGPAASAFGLLRDRAEMGAGRFRQSEAMPATAATIGKAISARIGHRGAVSPIWNRIEIINDPYTNASEGLIHLTAYILTNVGIADPKVYRHLEYKTA